MVIMNQSAQPSFLSHSQHQLLAELLKGLNTDQKIWLGGYISGLNESTRILAQAFATLEQPSVNPLPEVQQQTASAVKVLYGTRSGNSLKVAKSTVESLSNRNITADLINLNDYEPKNIKHESHVLIIISTDGEGDPPIAAEEFYSYIMGKKAPRLENLKYSVLALGDSSYKNFCKIGKDIDTRLKELGAERLTERIDSDVEYSQTSEKWQELCYSYFSKNLGGLSTGRKAIVQFTGESQAYSKSNPFPTRMLDKVKLNGRNSTKSTWHIELSLEGSELNYEPGDALGVIFSNDAILADSIIRHLKLNADKAVNVGTSEKTMREALIADFEISSLNIKVLENYNKVLNNNKLTKLLKDKDESFKFIYGRDLLDLMQEFPSKLGEEELLSVLRKIQPRLYSISSSQKAYPEEVHLTVGELIYSNRSRIRKGACSSYLANISDEQVVKVYIDENISFRLPSDSNSPVILIGAGTGIAPYRAFLQERSETASNGKSWMFFGERNFSTDFLYQLEWQKHLKNKTLTKLDVAFSRDQCNKMYVQHKLQENSKEFFRWVEEGAHVYLCGDKNSMAIDVKNTIINIIQSHGGMPPEKALEYFKKLRRENRFHEDVY
jgi:sulfite reductase (NADPH) flavoprotein alpha-component